MLYILYTYMSDTISLSIKNGENLSYVIDKKLDEELNTDVKLNLTEWNSVFTKIKANQVETNKNQFTDKDTDIKNGKHFVVDANSTYEIKKDVWAEIVKIAKQRFGGTETVEETPANPDVATDGTVTESKKTVTEWLKEAKIQMEDADIDDIVKKYDAIKAANPDIKENELKERIINYTNGLNFHKKEKQFAIAWEKDAETASTKIVNDEIIEAKKQGDIEKLKAAYHKMAKAYIELYDDAKGDGIIDIEELVAMEEKEQGRELTQEEREIATKEAINVIQMLCGKSNRKMDENTIASYLWVMSTINDKKGENTTQDITFEEWRTIQESIGYLSINSSDVTQEDIDKANKFREAMKEGYKNLYQDLKVNKK